MSIFIPKIRKDEPKMKEFDVTITETLKRTVKVVAETHQDAEEKAEREYDHDIHILMPRILLALTLKQLQNVESCLTGYL